MTPLAPDLPDFFIIGAAKSGTTSLYHYLDQHPDVYMPTNKEPHWFSRVPYVPGRGAHPVASEEEYSKLFSGRRQEAAAGDASPSYLWDKGASYRIKEAVPQAKIVAILRNPVERAYSHYLMDVKAGKQDLPFLEALRRDLRTKRKAWGEAGLYVDLGFYVEQLRRYFAVFDQRQIKVFLYEDLTQDPVALLSSLCEFLGVCSNHVSSIRTDLQHNTFSVPKNRVAQSIFRSQIFRSRWARALRAKMLPDNQTRDRLRQAMLFRNARKPPIDREALTFLKDLYREDIHQLQVLLDRDLGRWLGSQE